MIYLPQFQFFISRSLLYVTLCLTLFMAEARTTFAASPAPIVYTGKIHNDRTGRDILIRLNLIDSSESQSIQTSAVPNYLAELTIFIGDETSNEYITATYDQSTILTTSRELILQRNDSFIGRRFPVLRLKFDEDSNTASGTFFSYASGKIGQVTLKLGWDAPPGDYLNPVGGIYDTSCDYGSVEMKMLQIAPSRIAADAVSSEGLTGAINYLGNAVCHGGAFGDTSNCTHLATGSHNFYEETLNFNRGAWLCKRTGNDTLTCQIRGTQGDGPNNRCHFTKRSTKQLQIIPSRRSSALTPRPIIWKTPAPEIRKPYLDCEIFNQEFDSWLTHLRDGRKQQVHAELRGHQPEGSSNTDQCLVSGTVSLYFQTGEKLYYSLPQTLISLNQKTIVLETERSTDPILVFDREHFVTPTENSPKDYTGLWHSRLYGVVGTMHRIPTPNPGSGNLLPSDSLVLGANGKFKCTPKPIQIFLDSMQASSLRPFQWDPFGQTKYFGQISTPITANGHSLTVPGMISSFSDSSFDYFTNTLVLEGQSLYTGFVAADGLHLWGMTNKRFAPVSAGEEQICNRVQNQNAVFLDSSHLPDQNPKGFFGER